MFFELQVAEIIVLIVEAWLVAAVAVAAVFVFVDIGLFVVVAVHITMVLLLMRETPSDGGV